MPKTTKEETETPTEIVEDIEKSGVAERVAEKEEKLDEVATKEFEEMARAESTSGDIEEKKRKLLEKVAKLKGKLEKQPITEELKEQVKGKKKTDMLIPLEEYVKAGIYLGTRVVTPDMKPFVYRRRADGLAIFNTDLIDEKLKEGIEYLSKFESQDVIVVCKRQAGWKAVEMFSKVTGIRAFTKKYPAGILTNTQLPNFFEMELAVITDHWLDRNALHDTSNVRKNVLMVCDTNNFSKGAHKVIIGNNKSTKSLGVIFYLLARGYCKARGISANIPDLEYWTGERDDEVSEKIRKVMAEPGAVYGV